MKKKGFSILSYSKGARTNLALILSSAVLFLVGMIFAYGLSVSYFAPGNYTFNNSRNINFTFNATWDQNNEIVSNCTLLINSTTAGIAWTAVRNITNGTSADGQTNLTNSSGMSYGNYTFTTDGNFTWAIGCFNGTDPTILNFTTTNQTIIIDTTAPIANTTSNKSSPVIFDVFNYTVNITDNIELIRANWSHNASGTFTFHVHALTGTTAQVSNFTTFTRGGVVNFSVAVTDKVGNTRQNSTIVNVNDNIAPVVNTTVTNGTNVGIDEILNYTANITDETDLLRANFSHNVSGTFTFHVHTLSGTSAEVSNNTLLTKAGVFNFSITVTDTFGNIRQNSTIITVRDNKRPIANTTFNITTLRINNVVNFTGNITDETGILWANWTHNATGSLVKLNFTFSAGTVAATINNITTVSLIRGNLINFTLYVTDTSNNVTQNSTVFTVANTVPTTPSISNTSGLNVTSNVTINWSASTDADSEAITYTVYFAGGYFTTAQNNFTTNMTSEGTFFLNVSASDGTDSTANSSIWTITLDTVKPSGNVTLNSSSPVVNTVINYTANFSDVNGLLTANLSHNASGTFAYHVHSLTGTSAEVSNVTTLLRGGVINFSVTVTDSAGNVRQNSTLTTVTDNVVPVGNTTFNITSARLSGVVNFTGNITDETGILWANWTHNATGSLVKLNFTFNSGTTTATIGNITTVSVTTNGVINFTLYVTDTSNNVKQNSTVFTVGNTLPTVPVIANSTGLNVTRNVTINWSASSDADSDAINYTVYFNGGFFNTTELNFTTNMTADGVYTLNVTASDSTGTSTGSSIWNITLDRATPAFVASTLSNSTNDDFVKPGESIFIGLNISDLFSSGNTVALFVNISGQANNEVNITRSLSFNQSANLSFVIPIGARNNTVLNFTFKVNDSAGNSNITLINLYTVNDSAVPTLAINAPVSAQGLSSFSINASVSSDAINCSFFVYGSGNGMSETAMTLYGNNLTLSNSNCSSSEITNLTNGSYYNVTVRTYDINGNLNETNLTFSINDTTNHSVLSITISNIGSQSAIVTFTANESINSTITSTGSNTVTGGDSAAFEKTKSITLSFGASSSARTYNFTITTCDKAGHCITNTTIGFTTSATSSSSSSGGGGGGGSASTTSNAAYSAAKSWDVIQAGSIASLTANHVGIAVISVEFEAKNKLTNPGLTVDSLQSRPTTISSSPTSITYQYLELKRTNFLDSDMSSIKIKFRVPKSWMNTNNVNENNIVLFRYSAGAWNQLETAVVESDSSYTTYESTTPGFSYFAVGVKDASVQPTLDTSTISTPTNAICGDAVCQEGENSDNCLQDCPKPVEALVTTTPPLEEEKASNRTMVAWIIVALLIIGSAGAYYGWQRKKMDHKSTSSYHPTHQKETESKSQSIKDLIKKK